MYFQLGLCLAVGKHSIIITLARSNVPPEIRAPRRDLCGPAIRCLAICLRFTLQTKIVAKRSRSKATVLSPPASVKLQSDLDELNRELERLHNVNIEARTRLDKLEVEIEAHKREAVRVTKALQMKLSVVEIPGTVTFEGADIGFLSPPTGLSKIELVRVPAGETLIGHSDDQRTIYIPEFWISKYSVSNEMFVEFLNCYGNQVEAGVPIIASFEFRVG